MDSTKSDETSTTEKLRIQLQEKDKELEDKNEEIKVHLIRINFCKNIINFSIYLLHVNCALTFRDSYLEQMNPMNLRTDWSMHRKPSIHFK
jgi:hypothetical protein